MIHRFRSVLGLVVLAVAVTVAAASCVKTTTSAGRQVDDAAIKASVKAKLAADVKLSTLTNIEVNSTNGVVTLAGEVRDESDRIAAENVTRTVDGVVRVHNNLQVKNREPR
jgi:hyperosmotically inducible periplasmic protein